MKNIKYLLLIMTIVFASTSCDTYEDYDSDRIPVVGFTRKNININSIAEGTIKSTTVDVFASDISSEDRTFEIIEVPIDNTTEYPPTEGDYSFDTTVTIPAGERVGTITLTGDNTNGKITMDRTYFRLAVKNDDTAASGGVLNVGLRR